MSKKQKETQKVSKDPIEEYWSQQDDSTNKEAFELFSSEDIEMRTDINESGIKTVNAIMLNSQFLRSKGLFKGNKTDPFYNYIQNYLKLRVSKNRMSRDEFVNSIKNKDEEDTLNKLSEFQNIKNSKK